MIKIFSLTIIFLSCNKNTKLEFEHPQLSRDTISFKSIDTSMYVFQDWKHLYRCGYFEGLKNDNNVIAVPFFYTFKNNFIPRLDLLEIKEDSISKGELFFRNVLFKFGNVIVGSELDSLKIRYVRTASGGDAIYAVYNISKPISKEDYFYVHEYNRESGILKASFSLHLMTDQDFKNLKGISDLTDTMTFTNCRIHTRFQEFKY